MKKFAIVLGIILCVGAVIFIVMPKEYKIEIPGEKLQENASKKFPQTIGKAIKMDIPSAKDTDKPKLPGFLPNIPKPKVPALDYILTKIILKNPNITLSTGKLHIELTLDIEIMSGYLFEFEGLSLTEASEYETISQDLSQKFSDTSKLSSQATIKKSGKDTWLLQDQKNMYMLTKDKDKVFVFHIEENGKQNQSASTNAQAKISGELTYDREAKTIFLHGVTVDQLEIGILPDVKMLPISKMRDTIKEKVNAILQEQTIPVCDLKDTTNKEQPAVAKILGLLFLKEVTISEEKLTLMFSLSK